MTPWFNLAPFEKSSSLDKRRPIGESLGALESYAMNASDLWSRYRKYLSAIPAVGLTLDVSRVKFDDAFLAKMEPAMRKAYADMDALEKGAIANPDEKRMVGHYWLRDPGLAPTKEISGAIMKSVDDIVAFAADVHSGKVAAPGGGKFSAVLSIGIGGSALGPEFAADALGSPGGGD